VEETGTLWNRRAQYLVAGILILVGLAIALYGSSIRCTSNTGCPNVSGYYEGLGFTLGTIAIMILVVSIMAEIEKRYSMAGQDR
jgi:uncharacterized membrane protein